jgi:hypothetical protein
VIELDDERSDGEESKISSFFWNDPGSDDGDDGDRAPNSTGACLIALRV